MRHARLRKGRAWEAEERERAREAEDRENARQFELRKMEMEMRKVEMQAAQAQQSGTVGGASDWPPLNTGWDNSQAGRTKKFGDMLKHVLPPIPNETTELPQFFDTVEKLYNMYQVPDDLQSQLLIPMLNILAKSLIVRMPAADMGKYSKIKSFLLSELTPQSTNLVLIMRLKFLTKRGCCLQPSGCGICCSTICVSWCRYV